MALTLSGTNGVVGAGFTLDASGASVTAGVGTFGSVASSGAISGTTGTFSDQLTVSSGSDSTRGLRVTGGASGGTEIAQFRTNNGTVRFTVNNNVTLNSGNLVVATSGAGIDFSATGDGSGTDSSELFDDYEEGSWTPSIRNEGTTANWNSQTGKYVKIGQQVTVWWNADGGSDPRSGGSSSSLIMTGLPFSQSMFSNPILGHVGANKSSGTGLYSTSGLILSPFGQGGDQVRFGCGGQAINFSISYVAGCLTYTAAS